MNSKAAYQAFREKYEGEIPSAVNCLAASIDRCQTFCSLPEEAWISLRTANAIARVNKEFRRRTKPMEILAGEQSAYVILCFVALKMEQAWKSTPLGSKNLPVLKNFSQDY